MDLRERRERAVLDHMAAENVQDWDAVLATFAPGRARYELVASDEVFDGEDDVRAYWRKGRSVFPDQRNELVELHQADDAVIIEFWLRGTHLGGTSPTGRRFKARMAAVFTFEAGDDRIACERVYADLAGIDRQLRGADDVGPDD